MVNFHIHQSLNWIVNKNIELSFRNSLGRLSYKSNFISSISYNVQIAGRLNRVRSTESNCTLPYLNCSRNNERPLKTGVVSFECNPN